MTLTNKTVHVKPALHCPLLHIFCATESNIHILDVILPAYMEPIKVILLMETLQESS